MRAGSNIASRFSIDSMTAVLRAAGLQTWGTGAVWGINETDIRRAAKNLGVNVGAEITAPDIRNLYEAAKVTEVKPAPTPTATGDTGSVQFGVWRAPILGLADTRAASIVGQVQDGRFAVDLATPARVIPIPGTVTPPFRPVTPPPTRPQRARGQAITARARAIRERIAATQTG